MSMGMSPSGAGIGMVSTRRERLPITGGPTQEQAVLSGVEHLEAGRPRVADLPTGIVLRKPVTVSVSVL